MNKFLKKIDTSLAALIFVLMVVVLIFGFQVTKINAYSSLADNLNVDGSVYIQGNAIVNWRVGVGYLPYSELEVYGVANFRDVIFASTPLESQAQAVGTVSYVNNLIDEVRNSSNP